MRARRPGGPAGKRRAEPPCTAGRAGAAPRTRRSMASGWRVAGLVAAVSGGVACAHGSGAESSQRPMLGVGHYQVESIRSRATLDGVDRIVEISESGTRMLDASGAEHVLTERGALTLSSGGS